MSTQIDKKIDKNFGPLNLRGASMNRVFVRNARDPMSTGHGLLGQNYSPLSRMDTIVTKT